MKRHVSSEVWGADLNAISTKVCHHRLDLGSGFASDNDSALPRRLGSHRVIG